MKRRRQQPFRCVPSVSVTGRGLGNATSFAPGEQHPRAVLNRSLVELLRTLHAEDPTVNNITALARRFGLKRETVRDVINFETWI